MSAFDDIAQIKELVRQQSEKGYNYLVFLSGQPILGADDLTFFDDRYQAIQYSYDNTTDHDRYRWATSGSVLDLLETQEQQNVITNIKSETMKQENFDYLTRQVMLTGFGESVVNEMKQKMEQNSESFPLTYKQQFGKDEMEATLHFRKSDTSENYYFNKWDAVLKRPIDEETKRPKPDVKQTFYSGRDNSYSLNEAYNLMSGRFVHKIDLVKDKGEKFNAWVKLNFTNADTTGNFKFKYYGDKYGYDLDKALNKFPLIKELATEADKTKLADSLKRGNLQEVTLLRNGKEEKGFVEANAFARSVIVYDDTMKRLKLSEAKEAVSQSNNQSVEKDVKHDNKQTATQGANEGVAQNNATKQDQNNRKKSRYKSLTKEASHFSMRMMKAGDTAHCCITASTHEHLRYSVRQENIVQAVLSGFFSAIENNPRISTSHISLFCALLQMGIRQGCLSPILFSRPEVMQIGKISGKATFNTCIYDLHDCGFIRYLPSRDHRKKSKVFLQPETGSYNKNL